MKRKLDELSQQPLAPSIAPATAAVVVPRDLRAQWTLVEDERLAALIKEHGAHHWSTIASMLNGGEVARTGKQCNNRYKELRHHGLQGFALPEGPSAQPVTAVCKRCRCELSKDAYTKKQWSYPLGERVCMTCTGQVGGLQQSLPDAFASGKAMEGMALHELMGLVRAKSELLQARHLHSLWRELGARCLAARARCAPPPAQTCRVARTSPPGHPT
jgi:hypothetical protein